jgi:hypothetical protein
MQPITDKLKAVMQINNFVIESEFPLVIHFNKTRQNIKGDPARIILEHFQNQIDRPISKARILSDVDWLGYVQNTWTVGEYTFIEFEGKESGGELKYVGYYKRVRYNHIYDSLEHAIAGTIAKTFDGRNSSAGKFFMKMIS